MRWSKLARKKGNLPDLIAEAQKSADLCRGIATKIRKETLPDLPDLYVVANPLHKALWALAAAEDVGWDSPMTTEEIQLLLEELKASVTRRQVTNALSRTGRQDLRGLSPIEGVEVVYAEPGKKWSARKKLNELADTVKGDLLVADRYYGERSLLVLEELTRRKGSVRFLTCETGEKPAKLRTLFHDLMAEKKNLQVRIYPIKQDMHDRYILGDDALIIVGQGIKDLGRSESFVIRISESLAKGLMTLVRSSFEGRWQASNSV